MHTSKTSSVQQLRINIGPKQRNVRGVLGLVVLGFSVALLLQIVRVELTFWLGLSLFVLLQTGIMLLMEWNMGVCPVNALRGRQSMTGWFSIGKEQVKNQDKLKEARKAALKQLFWSTIMAIAITGMVLLVHTDIYPT